MIRGSLLAAAAAGLLSLLLHGLGLNVAAGDVMTEPEGAAPAPPETGVAFEDFAEVTPSAPEPEPAEPAEPPEMTAPDPVEPVTPTSRALVASDSPQHVTTPDSGTAQAVAPDAPEPAETPPPEAAPPPEGTAETAAETPPAEPLEPDAATEMAEAAPETGAEPEQPDVPEETEAPQESVDEALTPDAPEFAIAALPDEPDLPLEAGDETVTGSAVTRSLRPPKVRPSAEALGAREAAQPDGAATGSQRTAIQSSGLELLAREGISTGRATGNATTTNYAGKVLLQLNRARRITTSAQGTARVQFQIDPDGSVAWVRILSSSGTAGIERAATTQVRKSAPFPRPPDGTTQRLVFVYHSE